jgi:hypothetical protein
MNKNQFFYTRIVFISSENESENISQEFRDSFNVEMCIRSITNENGTVTLILNDFHDYTEETPIINPKTNKMTGFKKNTSVVQSEITLTKQEDIERFFKLTNIE